jgi:hypothetical protein
MMNCSGRRRTTGTWTSHTRLANMNHFILNLIDGDRERATTLLGSGRWMVGDGERHRDALAAGDRVLVFAGATLEFVGQASLATAFLVPLASGSTLGGVRLGDVEEWTIGVPLAAAVQRIDPTGSNPYVQANASGFRSGVVQITAREYEDVMSLRDEARLRLIDCRDRRSATR